MSTNLPFTGDESSWAWESDSALILNETPDLIQNALMPISWIIGKWESITADGTSPKPFKYQEQFEFLFTGQPLLNYRSRSWHPSTKKPMHFESGFLRLKPNTNEISFVTSHNFGVTLIEEGMLEGKKITLETKHIGRISFAKEPSVTELKRTYTLQDNGNLEVITDMGTTNYPIKNHLIAIYRKK